MDVDVQPLLFRRAGRRSSMNLRDELRQPIAEGWVLVGGWTCLTWPSSCYSVLGIWERVYPTAKPSLLHAGGITTKHNRLSMRLQCDSKMQRHV